MLIVIRELRNDQGHLIHRELLDLTRSPHNKMVSSKDNATLVDTADFFSELNSDINALKAAGWHAQHPDRDKGVTLWHHLVEACNHPDATDDVKALKLVVPEGL